MSISAANAQDVVRLSDYEFYDEATVAQDIACQQKVLTELGKKADGFSGLEIKSPNYWDSVFKGVRFFSYAANVKSDHGNVSANILCAVIPEQKTIAEIAINFDGKGLAGFKSATNKPPAESYRLMQVLQQPSQY